ncbi:MAG TPA: CPBP family glutamic-type intramembrane protease [Polyangiaceae bacterium]|nr:CPBP family glutamic-type intramembrane protease [Polyangiaceae bacterium]
MAASLSAPTTREIARGALYLVGLAVVFRAIHALVGNPMTSTILGAVVVSFVVARAGVNNEATNRASVLRALRAAACALAVVAAAVIAALVAGGRLQLVFPGATLVLSLGEAAAVGYRDELWLHGIPLACAWRAGVRGPVAVAYGALASAAVVALEPGATLPGVLLTLAAGAFFTVLWQRTRDGWAPIGAHFAWAWGSEALIGGELFDLTSPIGRLARGLGASGVLAWIGIAGFAVLTLLVARVFPDSDDKPRRSSRKKRRAMGKSR